MGLSFHYKGKLREPRSLKKMIEEVADISKSNKWSYHIFEEQFPNDAFTIRPNNDTVYGICFSPPKCETVCLTFLSNGRLCAFYNLNLNKGLKNLEEDRYLYNLSVKTQYCGSGIHKLLIPIFDYLNKNYFEDFEFNDEGQFWETRDEKLLEEIFNRYTNLIDGFGNALEMIPIQERETIEEYLIRIAQMTHKNNNKNGE